ncbi:hypothetical protein O7635_10200 [Asanoa sp. WMMD1127]|uniref:hypothetical protein n=1 Tax=Asanoa sp. WMMD1127 TaxID=3016107 RepID=UPI002417812A|nr:hypothetical protein [Asanoa sp. WMMD1127]MDG4822224.1 hypothetical protein [Asanoa sp. WMMD1127]
MVKPPARPLIRCAPLCLAAALVLGGVTLPAVALPGVALASRGSAVAQPGGLPDVPGLPTLGVPAIDLPMLEGGGLRLPPLVPVLPGVVPQVGPGVAGQPFDPDGWFDNEEPDDPRPPAEPDPEPDSDSDEDRPGPPPAPPEEPAPVKPDAVAPPAPAAPARPTAPPPPAQGGSAPRPAPIKPSPRPPRTQKPTPSPADTRGLDELFPDRPSTDTPAAGNPREAPTKAEPAGYGPPLIYSGLAGMLVSAIGIGIVLNRRRGW